ncbi:nickel-responsive transcriptional regulator NikR [Candidatus Bathyarchaeota archaeon]|jgi:CopG family nickel-responsive transcriptional regulator|nr:nickel-responsive transcriptional regulator NikR [Candidatus Bathyarchaeota archaeon]
MGKVERTSFSVSPAVLKRFDDVISKIGYEDRSRALQIAMTNFITEYTWATEKGRAGVGAILFTYSHRPHGLQEALVDIQHRYRDVVDSTTHVHLDESRCLEIVSVRGQTARIQELAKRLMKTRGVIQLKLSMVDV